MIPKKIHYCWFGNKRMPKRLSDCVRTWRCVMPDYEIRRWDESNSNLRGTAFVSEAYDAGKWAFVADYIRLAALYGEGGVYLDTDVITVRRFDDFLENDFFSAVEYHADTVERESAAMLINADGTMKDPSVSCPGIGVLASIIGSVPGHPFIKDCMDYYAERRFILPDGSLDTKVNPAIYAELAVKYGFRYRNRLQKIRCGVDGHGMVFYPSSVLTGDINEFTSESYALHFCENSWRLNSDKPLYRLKSLLKRNRMLNGLFSKDANKTDMIDTIINAVLKRGES